MARPRLSKDALTIIDALRAAHVAAALESKRLHALHLVHYFDGAVTAAWHRAMADERAAQRALDLAVAARSA